MHTSNASMIVRPAGDADLFSAISQHISSNPTIEELASVVAGLCEIVSLLVSRDTPRVAQEDPAAAAGQADSGLSQLGSVADRVGRVNSVSSGNGLAEWQKQRLERHVQTRMAEPITTAELAGIAHLSQYHFSRLFKRSFGLPPHRYLLRCRIERSKELMLTTTKTLADIALDCGLVDQSHFGRLFRSVVGKPPGAWRRSHGDAR